MTKFTIEDLRDIAYRGSYDDLERELALQLLASMEQAPVYLRPFGDDGETFVACDGNDERAITLYAAPQLPQPTMTELEQFAEFMAAESIKSGDYPDGWQCKASNAAHEYAQTCRAAMLHGAEPVTTAYKFPDDFDFDRFNDVVWLEAVASNPHMHSLTTSTIAMVALELNKRLEAGNSPVIPDGWIPVSERMPGSQEWVIVFAKWDNQQVLCWDDVANRWTDFEDQSYYADMFTHWMPLPAAPQQEVESQIRKGKTVAREEWELGARLTKHRFKP